MLIPVPPSFQVQGEVTPLLTHLCVVVPHAGIDSHAIGLPLSWAHVCEQQL